MENLTNIIEAILFASGRSVPIADIAEKLGVTENAVKKAVAELKERYSGERGIQLLEFNKKVQFASNPDYKEGVAAVLNPIREKELTRTILECAAIIAYKQPITRAEIEALRGVNSDYGVNALLELKLIYPCGRKDAIGHPVLFATTDEFLKRFKLHSLDELPDYEELLKKIEQPDAERDVYLYNREEWGAIDASKDSTLGSGDGGESGDDGESGGGGDGEMRPASKKREEPREAVEDGFEIPDFLKGLDGTNIVKIS